jgi:glycosyltransferase involved in cell wall biosynthesis
MISACTCVYNEEKRILNFLKHATKWADEVLVIDKSSTDKTAAIAVEFGAKVVRIPYSPQGFEKASEIAALCRYDWSWIFTPSEIPTRRLVETVRSLISKQQENGSCDVVQIPVQIWTFGKFVFKENGPWAISYQSRVINRKNCKFNDLVHRNVNLTGNSVRIKYLNDSYVFHGSHPDFDSFVRSHTEYAKAESLQAKDRNLRAREALAKAHLHDFDFQIAGGEGLTQLVAWRTYWNLVALACLSDGTLDSSMGTYNMKIDEIYSSDWV